MSPRHIKVRRRKSQVNFKNVYTLEGHKKKVTSIHIMDNSVVITGSWDKYLRVWRFNDKKLNLERELKHPTLLDRILITPDDRYIITVEANSTTNVWTYDDFSEHLKIESNDFTSSSVILSHDGQYLAVPQIKDWRLYFDIYKLSTGEKVQEKVYMQTSFDYKARNFTPDLYGSEQKSFTIKRGRNLPDISCKIAQHSDICISNNLNFIVEPYHKGFQFGIRVWDAISCKKLYNLQDCKDLVTMVKISDDNRYIVATSGDKKIRIWNLDNGSLLQTLKGHNDFVESVGLSADMKFIVSGSYDGTLILWEDEG